MNSSRPVRAWINQPSTLQTLHHRHGQRVLMVEHDDGSATLYPVSGPTISLLASVEVVSLGWDNKYVTDVKKFSGYKKPQRSKGKTK